MRMIFGEAKEVEVKIDGTEDNRKFVLWRKLSPYISYQTSHLLLKFINLCKNILTPYKISQICSFM